MVCRAIIVIALALLACSLVTGPSWSQSFPDSPPMDEGMVAMQSGRFDDAVEIFSQLIAVAPTAEVYFHRGLAYSALKKPRLALADLNQAVSKDSNNPSYRVERGQMLLATAHFDNAVEDFTAALRADPGNVAALVGRAQSFINLRRDERALGDLNEAIRRSPDNGLLYRLRGDALSRAGLHEEAVKAYDRAIALRPSDAVAHNNRGTALANLGRNKEAIEDFNRAMDIAISTPSQVEIPGLTGNAW